MNNLQNVENVMTKNIAHPKKDKNANNLYHVNFRSNDDVFIRQNIEQEYNNSIIKEQKKAKRKQNISWGISIAASLAIIAVVVSQFLGGKDYTKIKNLTEQLNNIKNEGIKREASEELARKSYERSLYRVQDLIYLDKLASTTEQRTVADIEKVKNTLDEKIIKQDKAKKAFTDFLGEVNYDIENKINLNRPIIIALDGPPGTCKSTLMQTAANALDMHLKKIPLSSIEKPGSLVGFERTYAGAKAGVIATAQIEGKTKKVFYMLDELEKCPLEVQNTLLSLLDDQAKFKDLYYNCEIDISQAIFGITTNEFEKLKGTALYDRIKPFIINVEKYDNDTKAAISKIKLEAALKANKMDDKVNVNDNIYMAIAKNTKDDGGRETTNISERQIITKLKNMLNNKKDNTKITVDENFIKDIIEK